MPWREEKFVHHAEPNANCFGLAQQSLPTTVEAHQHGGLSMNWFMDRRRVCVCVCGAAPLVKFFNRKQKSFSCGLEWFGTSERSSSLRKHGASTPV